MRGMKLPSEAPHPLALLRVVLPVVILISPELHDAPAIAASPSRLAFVPEGLGLVAWLPLSPAVARILQLVTFSSAALAVLGYWSRTSMAVLALSAGLLFSLSQRGGAVVHDMHLFWLAALLAASPCGDVWSLDAWGRARPEASPAYGVPIAFARLLLGLVYFFPGLHKLLGSGFGWMTSENVINHMRAKWLENGRLPFLRLDHAPLLCAIGAVGVVLFELSFVVLALVSKRTRLLAMLGGLVFHASTQIFFFIHFTSLWSLYVILFDGSWLERLDDAIRRRPATSEAPSSSMKGAVVVGALLVVPIVVQGVRGMTQAWPFACYPTFEHRQSAHIPDIAIAVEKRDGTTTVLTGRESRVRPQAEWAHVWRIIGAYDGNPRVDLAADHARAIVRASSIDRTTMTRMRVYRGTVSTVPEDWGLPPERQALITELEPPRD